MERLVAGRGRGPVRGGSRIKHRGRVFMPYRGSNCLHRNAIDLIELRHIPRDTAAEMMRPQLCKHAGYKPALVIVCISWSLAAARRPGSREGGGRGRRRGSIRGESRGSGVLSDCVYGMPSTCVLFWLPPNVFIIVSVVGRREESASAKGRSALSLLIPCQLLLMLLGLQPWVLLGGLPPPSLPHRPAYP